MSGGALLSSPLRLGGISLPNRLIRSATYEGAGDRDGNPGPELAGVYLKAARGGVGTIITGFCFVSKGGRAMHPRQCGMDCDDKIPHWEKIVAEVKRESPGTILIQQIAHAGRQTVVGMTGRRPLAPSPGRSPYFKQRPEVMREGQISDAIGSFAQAARRSRKAGFDAVQIHAAHGYLVHQFLSPAMNRRKDRWGEDRFSFLAEVISAVKSACGRDFPVFLKISGGDDDRHGMTPDLAARYIEGARELGVEAAEISYGTMDLALNIFRGGLPVERVFEYNPLYSGMPKLLRPIWSKVGLPLLKRRLLPFREAYNLGLAKRIRELTALPLILVGGIRELTTIERCLAEGVCDAVSLCRPLICEPDLGRKFLSGEARRSRCTNCNACAIMCDSGEATKCYSPPLPPVAGDSV